MPGCRCNSDTTQGLQDYKYLTFGRIWKHAILSQAVMTSSAQPSQATNAAARYETMTSRAKPTLMHDGHSTCDAGRSCGTQYEDGFGIYTLQEFGLNRQVRSILLIGVCGGTDYLFLTFFLPMLA